MKDITRIPGTGPKSAQVVFIGEAPGRQELLAGAPFVGPAGHLLDNWLAAADIPRRKIRLENVCERFPPAGAIANLNAEERTYWIKDLWQRLDTLYPGDKRPNLLVAVGAFALEALTGETGITKWRGSLLTPNLSHLETLDTRVRHWSSIKVIPILHPAYILRGNAAFSEAVARDMQLIAEESLTPHRKIPARTHTIDCSEEHAENWLEGLLDNPDQPIALDIETIPAEQAMESIAFAKDPYQTLSLPWRTWVPAFTKRLCALPNPKIMHNGLYDSYWLRHLDMPPVNYCWDTRYMHHVLNPRSISAMAGEDGHDLAYLQSLYTREPYHKSMVRDLGKRSIGANLRTKLLYGAIDTAVTYELYNALLPRLMQADMLDFYQHTTIPLLPVLAHIMDTGLTVNRPLAAATKMNLALECEDLRTAIEAYGADVFGPKGISYKKMATWLYTTLNLPPFDKKRANGTTTAATDTVALLRHQHLNATKCAMGCTVARTRKELALTAAPDPTGHFPGCPGPIGPVLADLLTFKRKAKEQDFYNEDRFNFDGDSWHSYCSYSPVTEEGRLKSSRNPYMWGTNHQNQPSAAKHIYIPDRRYRCAPCGNPNAEVYHHEDSSTRLCKACDVYVTEDRQVFLEVDLSQAESRVVYMISADPQLIELAQIPPYEKDMHRHYAAIILGKPEEDITKGERQLGKIAVHASQRGMKGKTLSDNMVRRLELFVPPSICQGYINNYLNSHPGILTYFSDVQQRLIKTRTLVNTFGRRWHCPDDRLEDTLFRAAYSFLPQSSVADLLFTHGLIPLYAWRQTFPTPIFNINVTVHDSILVSCLPEDAYRIAAFLRDRLATPVVYSPGGPALKMPCEFAIGTNWKHKTEFKQLPSERDFTAAAFALVEDR
jgi:uracil-DNA glycosylase family 4